MQPESRRDYEQECPNLYCIGGTPEEARAKWDKLMAEIEADGYAIPSDLEPSATEQSRLMQHSFGIYEPFRFVKL